MLAEPTSDTSETHKKEAILEEDPNAGHTEIIKSQMSVHAQFAPPPPTLPCLVLLYCCHVTQQLLRRDM